MNSFIILMHCVLVKEVTARGYCSDGCHIFLYILIALVLEIVDCLILSARLMLYFSLCLYLSIESAAWFVLMPNIFVDSVGFFLFSVFLLWL